MDINKSLQKIIDHYGLTRQSDKTVEEILELTAKISQLGIMIMHKKLDRSYLQNNFRRDLASEIADVENMLDQLKMIFLLENIVKETRIYKLNRTIRNIDLDIKQEGGNDG
jgi:hypothetical protein